ncbi:MAG: hypothetical protein ACI9HA_001652 [Dinoroseobacter sp.]|jgi:hypothetical protein
MSGSPGEGKLGALGPEEGLDGPLLPPDGGEGCPGDLLGLLDGGEGRPPLEGLLGEGTLGVGKVGRFFDLQPPMVSNSATTAMGNSPEDRCSRQFSERSVGRIAIIPTNFELSGHFVMINMKIA